MTNIVSFKFNEDHWKVIEEFWYKDTRPVVYIIRNTQDSELYVGETTNIHNRWKQHSDNPERKRLDEIFIISDVEFNKSATLDTESRLIQYLHAEEKYILQNRNLWLQNHNYFDREKYKSKFEVLWEKLKEMGIARHSLDNLKNKEIFKYSPYKNLNIDQYSVVEDIYNHITHWLESTFLVHGKPWTWKTIVAIFLLKYLKEQDETKDLKIWLVVPMTSLRSTIKKVFKWIKWLKPNMVIWPSDVKEWYDILIVDEAHRLKQRKNLAMYGAFDKMNASLWLGNEGTELDWIMRKSKKQIFLYDENQTIKPSDIWAGKIWGIKSKEYVLNIQERVQWWEEYLNFIDSIFAEYPKKLKDFSVKRYDLRLFSNFYDFQNIIFEKDKDEWLSRIVAGYAWERKTKDKKKWIKYDFEIDWYKLLRNTILENRPNSPNAINEIWCIHTIQWYDLNYVWVIIWPELSYDPIAKKIKVIGNNYRDFNWRRGVQNHEELERYIINIYKVLLTRWVKWTYIYIVDEELRKHLNDLLK